MQMNANTKREENLREQSMRFRVTSEEWQEIMERAESTGLTLSGYLRAAALNHQVRSVYDLEAIADLVKVNGDLGRVAGLLKLWLAEKPGQGAKRFEVDQMMRDFRALQGKLSGIMDQIGKFK